MKTLSIVVLSLSLLGCDQTTDRDRGDSDGGDIEGDGGLSFAPYVDDVLAEEGVVVILDQTIEPGEEISIPSVIGSRSVGYYVDDQFDLAEAGGFVRIEGSDGSSGGGAVGGVFKRQDGPIQAHYLAKNTGRLKRRLLVYTSER
ncbi:MAG: hypothetical protein Q7Q71_06065 [Verrucomicrobiota bacterium JB023]|nr:hypothetical protein [Verrucomicrobiota bacterium JB023]